MTQDRSPLNHGNRRLRVLAVEDSPSDARLLREAIADAGAGIELQVVGRLNDAVASVRREDFDCVLMDLGLPDVTGMDNVQCVRAAKRWQTIVVMTGLDSEEAAIGNLQRGAQDYVVKGSADGAELVRVIRRAIERNRVLADVDRMREEQYHQATHDALTDLPNRQLFMDRARQLLTQAVRHGQTFAVGYLDLDGFKRVNDEYGHVVGDSALRAVAEAIRCAMRESDTVARVGGDEFQFLLSPVREAGQAEKAVDRVRAKVRAIVQVDGHPVTLGASVGLAFYPRDGRSLDQLIVRADQAMYESKRSSRDVVARMEAGPADPSPAIDR